VIRVAESKLRSYLEEHNLGVNGVIRVAESRTEELLGRRSSGSGLEIRASVTLTTRHPSIRKVGTSPTSGGRSVGTVRSRTLDYK
jgi:hypothetical protein